jgi:hypothetical protein
MGAFQPEKKKGFKIKRCREIDERPNVMQSNINKMRGP